MNTWCRVVGSALALGVLAASCGGTLEVRQGRADAGDAALPDGDGSGAADVADAADAAPADAGYDAPDAGPADATSDSDASDAPAGPPPPAPTVLCARAFAVDDPAGSDDISEDATGAVTIAGTMSGAADFGTGTLHAELAGGPGSGVFVAAYDPQCNPLYSREFGSRAVLWSMAGDGVGNAVLAGAFDEPLDFGTGPLSTQGQGMFLAKLGPQGNTLWVRSWESDRRDVKVAIGSGGAIWVGGAFQGTMDIMGHTLVASGSDGIYVVRLTPDGSVVWAQGLGGTGIGTVGSLLPLASGGVAITGGVYAPVQVGGFVLDPAYASSAAYLLELDATGAPVLARTFPSKSYTWGIALAGGPGGSIVLRAQTDEGTDFGSGMLVPPLPPPDLDDWSTLAKFDSSWNLVWDGLYGRRDMGWDRSIAVDANGNVLMAGSFIGSLDFGNGALWAGGTMRAYVAKLDPDGHGIWSLRIGEGPGPQGAGSIVVNAEGDSAVFGGYTDNAAPLVANAPGPEGIFFARLAP